MPLELHAMLPNAEQLLALEPEELGGLVLEILNTQTGRPFQREAFIHPNNVQGYPRPQQQQILSALSEAWNWLLSAGLVAEQDGYPHITFFVTRRGLQLRTTRDFEAFRKARLLPKELLHGAIAEPVWILFIRGDYDTAVFKAFKEVEVRVRAVGRFQDTDIGTDLMRKAFDSERGPLTNLAAPKAEREALSHLATGAIGSYKNPHSHRNVAIKAEEAVEMIMLASHILKIVDSRAPADGPH